MNYGKFIKFFHEFLNEKMVEIKDKNEEDITKEFVKWLQEKNYEAKKEINLDNFLIKGSNLLPIVKRIFLKYSNQNIKTDFAETIIDQLCKCLGNGKFNWTGVNSNDVWIYPKILNINENNIKNLEPQFLICEAKNKNKNNKVNDILDDYAIISACKIACYILFDCNDVVNTASIIYFSDSDKNGKLILDLEQFPNINIRVCDFEEKDGKNNMSFSNFIRSDFVQEHQIVCTKIKSGEYVGKISNDKKISPSFIKWFKNLTIYIRTLLAIELSSVNEESIKDLNDKFKKLEDSWKELETDENTSLDKNNRIER